MNTASYEKPLSWLALFVSACTLICCALPIEHVSFGPEKTQDPNQPMISWYWSTQEQP